MNQDSKIKNDQHNEIAELTKKLEKMERERNLLKGKLGHLQKLTRFQFIVLGFYRTQFNYEQQPGIGLNIMQDKGLQAEQSLNMVFNLGYSPDEITGWEGPGVPWTERLCDCTDTGILHQRGKGPAC